MNQENNQVVKLRKELTSDFQQKLNKNQLNIAHREQEISIFGFWTEIETHLDQNNTGIDFPESFQKMIHCPHSFYDIDWQEVSIFLNQLNQVSQTRALSSFQQTLNSTQNTYRNIITGMKKIQTDELAEKELENQKLISKIAEIEAGIEQFRKSQQKSKKPLRSLDSSERISLENLRYKYQLLSEQAKDTQEQKKLLEQHSSDLANSLELLEKSYQALEQELQTTVAQWNITTADLVLARGEIAGLQTSESGLRKLKEQSKQDYLHELYITTKLEELLMKLAEEQLIQDQEQQKELDLLRTKLAEAHANLSTNEKTINELKNAHFSAKVKYMSLLAVDSTRNFLPGKIGQWITLAETGIFVSEATRLETGTKLGWGFFGVFMFLIWSYGLFTLIKKLVNKLSRKNCSSLESVRLISVPLVQAPSQSPQH